MSMEFTEVERVCRSCGVETVHHKTVVPAASGKGEEIYYQCDVCCDYSVVVVSELANELRESV